jgi:hypothetical protein
MSFFFNARSHKIEMTTLGLYRSLLLQLLEKEPTAERALDHLGPDGARFIDVNGWNIEILEEVFAGHLTRTAERLFHTLCHARPSRPGIMASTFFWNMVRTSMLLTAMTGHQCFSYVASCECFMCGENDH